MFDVMKNNLEDRLIDFAVSVGKLSGNLLKCSFSTHLYKQLMRSASAAPLNYAESQSSESIRDFVHKLFIALKELQETKVNLKILFRSDLIDDIGFANRLLDENRQLINIISKSITTAKSNNPKVFSEK